jgi:hypothetical protein
MCWHRAMDNAVSASPVRAKLVRSSLPMRLHWAPQLITLFSATCKTHAKSTCRRRASPRRTLSQMQQSRMRACLLLSCTGCQKPADASKNACREGCSNKLSMPARTHAHNGHTHARAFAQTHTHTHTHVYTHIRHTHVRHTHVRHTHVRHTHVCTHVRHTRAKPLSVPHTP